MKLYNYHTLINQFILKIRLKNPNLEIKNT